MADMGGSVIEAKESGVSLSTLLGIATETINDNNLDSEIEIFQNALELSEIKARDVMVPRAEIIALENTSNIDNAKKLFVETGFSKIPIYRNSIDNIVGYIHSFDFLKKPQNINEFILPTRLLKK